MKKIGNADIAYPSMAAATLAMLALCLGSGAAHAESAQIKALISQADKKPDQPQPPPCGDQGTDNRPNSCARLIGGVWVLRHSKCTPNGDGTFTYTHCNGAPTLQVESASGAGTHLCCQKSEQCPDARYIGSCLD